MEHSITPLRVNVYYLIEQMNKFSYIFILILFLGSCTSNTILKKPDDLIPKDQMVELLTDLYLANGGENIKNADLKKNVNYYPLVFEKHNIDTLRFKKSNYFYTSKIDDYDEILKKIDTRLKNLKKQYEDEQDVIDSLERIKKDSIRKSRKNYIEEPELPIKSKNKLPIKKTLNKSKGIS